MFVYELDSNYISCNRQNAMDMPVIFILLSLICRADSDGVQVLEPVPALMQPLGRKWR